MRGIRRGSSLVGDAVVLGWAHGRFPKANAVHYRHAARYGHSGRSREKHSIYVPGAANMFEAVPFWLPLLRPPLERPRTPDRFGQENLTTPALIYRGPACRG